MIVSGEGVFILLYIVLASVVLYISYCIRYFGPGEGALTNYRESELMLYENFHSAEFIASSM